MTYKVWYLSGKTKIYLGKFASLQELKNGIIEYDSVTRRKVIRNYQDFNEASNVQEIMFCTKTVIAEG